MFIPKWLRKYWKEQPVEAVLTILTLTGAPLLGVAAAIAKPLTFLQTFGLMSCMAFFLIWAVTATIKASRIQRAVQPDPVTTENIEQRLTEWIRKLKLRSKPLSDKPEAYHFNYQVDGPMGQPINIERQKNATHLLFSAGLLVTQQEDQTLKDLGGVGASKVYDRI